MVDDRLFLRISDSPSAGEMDVKLLICAGIFSICIFLLLVALLNLEFLFDVFKSWIERMEFLSFKNVPGIIAESMSRLTFFAFAKSFFFCRSIVSDVDVINKLSSPT